jgi:hypothetical protein
VSPPPTMTSGLPVPVESVCMTPSPCAMRALAALARPVLRYSADPAPRRAAASSILIHRLDRGAAFPTLIVFGAAAGSAPPAQEGS